MSGKSGETASAVKDSSSTEGVTETCVDKGQLHSYNQNYR